MANESHQNSPIDTAQEAEDIRVDAAAPSPCLEEGSEEKARGRKQMRKRKRTRNESGSSCDYRLQYAAQSLYNWCMGALFHFSRSSVTHLDSSKSCTKMVRIGHQFRQRFCHAKSVERSHRSFVQSDEHSIVTHHLFESIVDDMATT